MAAVTCKMSSMVLLAPFCLTQARTKAVTFSFVIGNQRLETMVIGMKRRRYVHTSSRTYKIFEVPSELEANTLRKAFPDPKGLIHRLLEPLVSSGMTDAPHLSVAPRLGGQFWRACLHLQWPGKVTISAVHSSITGAEENVYLLACDLFKNIGLLYGQGSGEISPVDQGHVLSLLQALHTPRWPDPFNRHTKLHFHFTTTSAEPPQLPLGTEGTEDREERRWRWCTNVASSWPYSFQVRCMAPTWEASQHAAVLQTCIKLKALGLLSSNNHLAESRLVDISQRFQNLHWSEVNHSCKEFDPDFEIFSDASTIGFGAYLVTKEDNRVHWLANSWSEHFPDNPTITRGKSKGKAFQMDSNFCELYSLVAAVFTWKHKFVGKKVLVWSDNISAVHLVNWGECNTKKKKRLTKLFCILAATSQHYSIELRACHIQRTDNRAADLLSRFHVDAFREAIPEANSCRKKTKKLLFWNPLQFPHIELPLR